MRRRGERDDDDRHVARTAFFAASQAERGVRPWVIDALGHSGSSGTSGVREARGDVGS